MSVVSSAELRELLSQANELPPHERAKFLDRACAGNAQLRGEVQTLLNMLEQADDFMPESGARPVTSATGEGANTTDAWGGVTVDHLVAGSTIGPYRVVQWLGEGAFGTVYLVEQEHPVKRQAAL